MSKIKSVFRYVTEDEKKEFKHSHCLLTISVGQETHEGERFASTIDLINTSFDACIISLYDSLQRHTMALSSIKKPDDFYEISVREGDLWLERNGKYYSRLTIPSKITRWDAWLHHPNYIAQKNKLIDLINQDTNYKATFDNTINNYLSKYASRLNDVSTFDKDRAQAICFDYILEECTVLCLWPELQCQFEVYPNLHNAAMQETRRRFILSKTPDLLRSVQLGFRNASQIKAQHFKLLHQEENA